MADTNSIIPDELKEQIESEMAKLGYQPDFTKELNSFAVFFVVAKDLNDSALNRVLMSAYLWRWIQSNKDSEEQIKTIKQLMIVLRTVAQDIEDKLEMIR